MEVQAKMRRNMPFGQLLAWLRVKFEKTEDFQLRSKFLQAYCPLEWRIIFESDTPAHVRLSSPNAAFLCTKDLCVQLNIYDRTTLRFVAPDGVEAIDVTTL
jgi:hypothetical protein